MRTRTVTERAKPINRRFPGQYVMRVKLWMPDGSWLYLDGPISEEGAQAIATAACRGAEPGKRGTERAAPEKQARAISKKSKGAKK